MNDPLFVVLRGNSHAVQTIGPSGQAFRSVKEAGAFAKAMSDRYTQQTFYVCQAVAIYEVQGRATVRKVILPKPQKKPKVAEEKRREDPLPSNPPNVYSLPTRVGAAE